MRVISILTVFLVILPSASFGGVFFEKEAAEARKSWQPFDPEDLIESVFSGEPEESEAYRIEINIPARRLFLLEGDRVIRDYAVAVGSDRYKTPVGPRRGIKDITWNPWWFPPPYSSWAKGEKPAPPGPGNPLGRVKMSLGGDIFLHGTNKEISVGRPVSHGCMRMRNKDAEELAWFFQKRFSRETDEALLDKYRRYRSRSFNVPLDTIIPVRILYDRVAVHDKELEVYPDIYGKQRNVKEEIFNELLSIGVPPWVIDPDKLDEIKAEKEEMKILITELLLITSSGF